MNLLLALPLMTLTVFTPLLVFAAETALGPLKETASQPVELQSRHRPVGGLAGFIVDRTLTVAGHDFYKQFATEWRDGPLADQYSVSVHERPSGKGGTIVWVAAGQTTLFEALLPTSRAKIPAIASAAAAAANEKVVEIDLGRLFHEPDLAPDEL